MNTKCPNDTNNDGDCHLCHKTGKCLHLPNSQPETAPATAHTPFPWKLAQTGIGQPYIVQDTGRQFERNVIAQFHAQHSASVVLANAEIILSIPALLAERDRLRDAASDFVENVRRHNIAGFGEIHVSTDASFRVLRDALANTTSSESARLRESNAELVAVSLSMRDAYLGKASGDHWRSLLMKLTGIIVKHKLSLPEDDAAKAAQGGAK